MPAAASPHIAIAMSHANAEQRSVKAQRPHQRSQYEEMKSMRCESTAKSRARNDPGQSPLNPERIRPTRSSACAEYARMLRGAGTAYPIDQRTSGIDCIALRSARGTADFHARSQSRLHAL